MEELLIITVCLAVNALFACFEMAFVTVSKGDLRNLVKSGSRSAAQLLKLRQNPERTLSVIQVGITLVGIISAAAGGAGAEEAFAPYFQNRYSISENAAEGIAIILVVLPLTFLNVIFGELIPKAVALRSPLAVSTFGVNAIAIVDRLFSPLVWFMERITKAFLRLLSKNRASAHVSQVASVDIDHLSKQTQQYVLNLVGIEQRKNEDVMVTWDSVDFVDEINSRDEVATIAIRSGHTRLPVLKEGKVIGLLHSKEFITMLASGAEEWRTIIRPIIHAQPATPALGTLRKMQEQKSHMAVVLRADSPIGIVTFEDIIEEVVGEFYDEDDDGTIQKLLSSQAQRRLRK